MNDEFRVYLFLMLDIQNPSHTSLSITSCWSHSPNISFSEEKRSGANGANRGSAAHGLQF